MKKGEYDNRYQPYSPIRLWVLKKKQQMNNSIYNLYDKFDQPRRINLKEQLSGTSGLSTVRDDYGNGRIIVQ